MFPYHDGSLSWRAVDQHGHWLGIPVQSRRRAKAAARDILPGAEYWQSHCLNARAEMSHQRTWRQEQKQFPSGAQARHWH